MRLTRPPLAVGDDPGTSGTGRAWVRWLVFGVVVPVTAVVVAAAGWYIVTGRSPLTIFHHSTSSSILRHAGGSAGGSAHVVMPMPPPSGPETSASALLRPPAAATPAATSVAAPRPAATPTPAAAPAEKPAEKPAATAETVAASRHAAAPQAPAAKSAAPAAITEPLIPPGGEPLAPPSFRRLPARNDMKPLPEGPQPALLQPSGYGPLPIIAGERVPAVVYARPFTGKAGVPRVAVIVTGLGLSKEATEAAIAKLPPQVDLSFSPYAARLDTWVRKAREHGHEVLIDLPLEPGNFPMHDAGPMAVMARDAPSEAIDHLRAVLGRATSYVGVAAGLRSPVAAGDSWGPLLREIRDRGLVFVGDGLVGVVDSNMPPAASVTLVADEVPFRAAIDARLERLLAVARRDGRAVTYLSPLPVSYERLVAWAATLPQMGVVLAPLTAVVKAPAS